MSISPKMRNKMLASEAPISIPIKNSIKTLLLNIQKTAYN
jgi:hypothetical protein